MTGSLHELLKKDDVVHIRVDKDAQDRYFPEWLHDITGSIWNIDEEHIYLYSYYNIEGKSLMSGPHRFCWLDITVEKVHK
jgi:hypothetical protein